MTEEIIRNEEFFKETLDSSAEVRKDINQRMQKRMSKLTKAFRLIFGRFEENNVFKLVKDMIYYKGGYPGENSPAKLDTIIDKIGHIIHFYNYLGRSDELKRRFDQIGIDIDFDNIDSTRFVEKNGPMSGKKQMKTDQLWMELFGVEYSDQQPKQQQLNLLLGDALELQEEICKASDSIKVDAADLIEQQCDIKKRRFIEGVNIIYKKLIDKDYQANIEKIANDIEQAKNVLETILK